MRPILLSILLFCGCVPAVQDSRSPQDPDAIESFAYQGEQYQLYPNQLTGQYDPVSEEQRQRIVDAARAATVALTVASVSEMVDVVDQVAFPIVSQGTIVPKQEDQLHRYHGMFCRLPFTDNARYFIYKQAEERLELIQDAEFEYQPLVGKFEVLDSEIIYFRVNGENVVSPIVQQAAAQQESPGH